MTIRFGALGNIPVDQGTAGRRRIAQPCLSVGSALISAVLLAGCSQVPDAVNPVEWYRGASDWIAGTPETEATA